MNKSFFGRLLDNLTGKSLKTSEKPPAKQVNIPQLQQRPIQTNPLPQARLQQKAQPQLPEPKTKITNQFTKIAIKLFILFISIFLVIGFVSLAIFLTKADQSIFISNIEGYVYDDFAQPVSQATIKVGEQTTKTDENGFYSFKDIGFDQVEITLSSEGYSEINETVVLERKFFDYSYKKNFFLESTTLASIYGKFVSPNQSYEFQSTDKLLINGQIFKIKSDGSFIVTKLETGFIDFQFTSPDFADFSSKIEIVNGINKINDINLSFAADIIGDTRSFVTESSISNVEILITNNQTDLVEFDKEKNIFKISDLATDKSYSLVISAPGYETREYSIDVVKGENRLFGLNFVEQGKALRIIEEDDISLLAISDFDGKGEEKLFALDEYDPEDIFFDSEVNKIYFLSAKESLRTNYVARARVAYEYDLNKNEVKRLTTVLDHVGLVFPSFKNSTLISITRPDRNSAEEIKLLNLNGDLIKVIRSLPDKDIEKILVSRNLTSAVTFETTRESKTIVYTNIETSESRDLVSSSSAVLFDIDSLGNRVIFSDKNEQTGFTNLQMYDNRTKEKRVLIPNYNGTFTFFLNDSDNEIVFVENQNGKDKIFTFNIEKNSKRELIELRASDEIVNITQNGTYLLYEIGGKVYVTDIDFPKAYKEVGVGILW